MTSTSLQRSFSPTRPWLLPVALVLALLAGCSDEASESRVADAGVADSGAGLTDTAADSAVVDLSDVPLEEVDGVEPGDTASGSEVDLSPLPDDKVRVVRDQWGVPHVLAATERGAGYGLGWAQATDQLETMLTSLWTAQGRRAEIDGESALEVDRAMRLLRLIADVEGTVASYPQPVRAYLEGFVDGINAYMDAHPEQTPDWAEPVRAEWVVGLGRLFFFVPQVAQANSEREGLGPGLARLAFSGIDEFEMFGSNGWAIAPERTAEGVAMLLGDPHLPFYFEWRLYEAHVRAPSFEVAGAGFVGLPLPVFGRNRDVAWTWTWNNPDHADVYELTLDPEDPERYLFDGGSEAFLREEAVFRLSDGREVSETLRWSVHGPVVHHDPEAGVAVAYFLSAMGQTDSALQFFEMAQATDLDSFSAALSRLQVVSFHSVAADSDGSVQYVWNARVPRRPDGLDAMEPLDGTTSQTLWDASDPVPFEALPQVRDPAVGYVQNCNNAVWNTTQTGDDPALEDLPGGVNLDDVDTARAWRARQVLAPPAELTEAEALAFATEGTFIPAGPLLPQLREAWSRWGQAHEEADILAEAMEVFEGWEGEPALNSPAPTLFLVWSSEMAQGTFFPVELLEWRLEDLSEERGRRMLDALVAGIATLDDLAGFWTVPWGTFHALQRGSRRVPIESGQHPAISMMNCNVDPINDPRLSCSLGSGYTFFNVMERPIRTMSITPFGATDDPALPYYDAQTPLYARRELKPLPFTDLEMGQYFASELILELP